MCKYYHTCHNPNCLFSIIDAGKATCGVAFITRNSLITDSFVLLLHCDLNTGRFSSGSVRQAVPSHQHLFLERLIPDVPRSSRRRCLRYQQSIIWRVANMVTNERCAALTSLGSAPVIVNFFIDDNSWLHHKKQLLPWRLVRLYSQKRAIGGRWAFCPVRRPDGQCAVMTGWLFR